jgi:hypothetical protein
MAVLFPVPRRRYEMGRAAAVNPSWLRLVVISHRGEIG